MVGAQITQTTISRIMFQIHYIFARGGGKTRKCTAAYEITDIVVVVVVFLSIKRRVQFICMSSHAHVNYYYYCSFPKSYPKPLCAQPQILGV